MRLGNSNRRSNLRLCQPWTRQRPFSRLDYVVSSERRGRTDGIKSEAAEHNGFTIVDKDRAVPAERVGQIDAAMSARHIDPAWLFRSDWKGLTMRISGKLCWIAAFGIASILGLAASAARGQANSS